MRPVSRRSHHQPSIRPGDGRKNFSRNDRRAAANGFVDVQEWSTSDDFDIPATDQL